MNQEIPTHQMFQDIELEACLKELYLLKDSGFYLKTGGKKDDDIYKKYMEFRRCKHDDQRFREFLKYYVALFRTFNQKTQAQGKLLEITSQSKYLLTAVVGRIFYHRHWAAENYYPQFLRDFLEAGWPRLGFYQLWSRYLSHKNVYFSDLELVQECLDERGDWIYQPEGSQLKLVFKHRELTDFSPSYDPYKPWLWLLSWFEETSKMHLGQVNPMMDFLLELLGREFEDEQGSQFIKIPIFTKPARTLCYFLLSELSLTPGRTGGPDLKMAQDYVDRIAQEHPWGLFDEQLPKTVLQHCAEMRWLKHQGLLSKLNQASGQPAWEQKEFLEAAPEIFPALHALLHSVKTQPVAGELKPSFNLDKAETIQESPSPYPSEERLKYFLQVFNPHFFAELKEEQLPSQDSLAGKICFTLLPHLIEYYLNADAILKEESRQLSDQDPAKANAVLQSIQTTLSERRQSLARLMCQQVHQLLSHQVEEIPDDKVDAWLQGWDKELRGNIVGHALSWPTAILQQEKERLVESLTSEEKNLRTANESAGKPAPRDTAQLKAIAVLEEGCKDITRLTEACLEAKLPAQEYPKKVQGVLNQVRENGGKYVASLKVVARVAANLLIVLSVGLLYPLFKKDIESSHEIKPSSWLRYCFYSLESKRAATIQCIEPPKLV